MSLARRAMLLFAALGVAVSAYLTWIHYSGTLALCLGVGGCEAVQTSRYAMVGAVPVALIGAAGFLAMLAAATLYARGRSSITPLFALSLGATVYVAYLTYIELFVLGAVCPWCVTVAVCAVAVFALAARELATTG